MKDLSLHKSQAWYRGNDACQDLRMSMSSSLIVDYLIPDPKTATQHCYCDEAYACRLFHFHRTLKYLLAICMPVLPCTRLNTCTMQGHFSLSKLTIFTDSTSQFFASLHRKKLLPRPAASADAACAKDPNWRPAPPGCLHGPCVLVQGRGDRSGRK